MKRGEILDEAKLLVTQVREQEHGDPDIVYDAVAAVWSAYLNIPIDRTMVFVMLMMMKFCRDPRNKDNWVDIAGYAALAGEANDAERKG